MSTLSVKSMWREPVLTEEEKTALRNVPGYWTVAKDEGSVTLRSKKTGQYWIIQKTAFGRKAFLIYHKYRKGIPHYHFQKAMGSVESALDLVCGHDQKYRASGRNRKWTRDWTYADRERREQRKTGDHTTDGQESKN